MGLAENSNGMVMPVGPVSGFGGSGVGWGDGSFWIIVLFLFALMGNGWNVGGYGGGNDGTIQRGFDQSAVMSGISGLSTASTQGFANAEVSRCNSQANILATLNANQNANNAAMNALAMSLQNCCCENRSGLADLKYTVATEACSDRAAVSNALRDIIDAGNANTQRIIDRMCQQEIDALKAQNANLQTQLNLNALAASQGQQTAQILADNAAQTVALEQYLAPVPRPAYVVQNPNCCAPTYNYGYGCGM